jgi:hypothetical protein
MKRYTGVWLALALVACAAKMHAGQAAAPQEPATAAPSTIVLPPKMVAGERGTLAVLDSAGRLVSGAAVDISGGGQIQTDAAGRGTFVAPKQPGVMTASLADNATFTTAIVPAPPQPAQQPPGTAPAASTAQADLSWIVFPQMIALGDRLTLEGAGFRGDAQLDNVFLGDQPALVLAASSIALVALPNPHTVLGKTQLSVEAGGHSLVRALVTVVALDVAGPTKPLSAGKNGILAVEVNGTDEPVAIEVRNLSPDVVRLPRGNVAEVKTSGGKTNVAKIELSGIKTGDYAVSAHLVAPGAGAP